MIQFYVGAWATSPFAKVDLPWIATQRAEELIWAAIPAFGDDYRVSEGIAIHHSARIEDGAVIANYRNEKTDKRIRIRLDDQVIDTGVDKFGALVGDESRIGANAVIAPGALLAPASRVGRLELVDQQG